jgi:hypothetical protein
MSVTHPAFAQPPAAPSAPRTVWPTAIGVIGIVFGALGFLGGCFGAVSPFFMDLMGTWLKDLPGGSMQVEQFEAIGSYAVATVAIGAAGMLLGGMLLLGSLGLLQRRRWGAWTCIAWAIGKVTYAVPKVLLSMEVNRAQFQAMADAPRDPATQPPMPGFFKMLESMGAVFALFELAFLCVLPAFILIWLLRPRIRAEVRTWR